MTYCRYEMKQERIYNQISPCSKRLIYFFNFQDENSDEDVDDVDDDVEEESKSSSVDSNVEKTDKTEEEAKSRSASRSSTSAPGWFGKGRKPKKQRI